MADPVEIVVGGIPVAKGRARITRAGFAFTPSKTRKFEAHIRLAAQDAMSGRAPLAGPLVVHVIASLPVPKSWSRKRRAAALAGETPPTTRPDGDNYLKAALDGINEIVCADDSQFVHCSILKQYAEVPELRILVKEWGT